MATLTVNKEEIVLEETPGHFEKGIWITDPPKYKVQHGHWEPGNFGRFANAEFVNDQRFKRFILTAIWHEYNDPDGKEYDAVIGTTDDPEQAQALFDLWTIVADFGYEVFHRLEFADRRMTHGWEMRLGGN
jgi:hypothetical protein